MRIFLASIGLRSYGGERALWAVNLLEPLIAMGHDVVESCIDWDAAMANIDDDQVREDGRPLRSQKLVEEVRQAHEKRPIDLFLSYLYSVHIDPGAIDQIRRLSVPTVNFFCNAAHQFHLVEEIAPAFDYCWVPEKQALASYRHSGARPLHIQMGANPAYYRPLPGIERTLPVTFAGSLYADRALWLARIYKRGIPLQIFSGVQNTLAASFGDRRSKGSIIREALEDVHKDGLSYIFRRGVRYVSNRRARKTLLPAWRPRHPDLLILFCSSQAVLNLSNVFDGGRPGGRIKAHVRLREFEVPLCRALFFPQHCDELEEYYDIEREVVGWKTVEEVCDKAKYYMAHPSEAERVREAGYRRALNEHTAEKRFQQLFAMIGMRRDA